MSLSKAYISHNNYIIKYTRPLIIFDFSVFIITMLKKIILGLIILVFLSVIGLVLFFPLNSFVKDKIDKALGHGVSFKNLKIGWSAITADDVVIKTSSGTDFLNIKLLRLKPSLWGLLKKRVEIENIELNSPSLTIKRDRNGRWLLPEFSQRKKEDGRSFELIIKSFEVNKGELYFSDGIKGANLNLTNVEIKMRSKIFSTDKASVNASGRLPISGNISIKSEGDITTGIFKGILSIKDMDMTLLRPYMKDIEVKKGRLNLDSSVSLEKGYVRAPSVLRVKDLDMETRGVIMGVSAPLVIELTQKKGEIAVNFNMWGRWNNIQNDLRESFQKKVFSELGRTITSPIEDVIKGISNLLPRKK